MLEMIRLEADSIADPERTLQLLVEAGEIYQDKVGDVPRAVEAFAQVLARQPRHAKAFHRLESIYSAQSAAAPLIQLLVARAEALDTPDDQAELYAQAARVAQEQLADRGQAIKLYREVLDRKPLHAKALQRIGPLLVEAEDWNGALDAFHKLVSVTADAGVRAQGFRALGTLYEERKDDLVKAVQSYQHAVQADPSDAESLRRLARVYKTAEDWSSSVNVLLRLAEVQREPAQRIVTLLELGNIYEVGFGDLENASLALQKALEIDPVHITAILRLADLYERAGDWRALGQVAEQFARALPAHERRRAVPLQIKMADVYEHRLGDDAKAGQELRQALEVEPQNARALEMLARLYAKSAQTFPQAVDIHRRLLRLDPFRVESYHDMRRMFEKRGEYDKAFVCCEILVFLRAQQQDEDLFFHEHKGKVAPIAERNLSPEDHERLLVHPDERGVARAILEVLGLELSKAYPADLAPYELNARTDKHGPRSDLAIRKLADSVATVLGAPLYDLWVTKKHDIGLFLENEEVPALIVGAGVMRRIQERELRFLLARQLERVKAAQQLWFKLPASEVDLLVWGAAKLARPDLRVERDALELDNMVKKLTRFVSRRGRKSLDELAPRIGTLRFDVERHRTASLFTANRAGLALSNDVEIAVRALARDAGVRAMFADASGARETIGQSAEVRELLAYAVSEEYFAARAKLGFSIQS
jgi:tetratricopeptide (TPR) repeat protein